MTLPARGGGSSRLGLALVVALMAVAVLVAACERTEAVQRGYRGTGEFHLYKPSAMAALEEINRIPPPEEESDPEAPPASEVFENVKVLTDVNAVEVSRLMQAFTTWVAPIEGCDFCHDADNLVADIKYPKVVSRRMIEMTRYINTEWKSHVGETGVTCWTCHRGQAVPTGDWFDSEPAASSLPIIGNRAGQNAPSPVAANSALPGNPLARYLAGTGEPARVQKQNALRLKDDPHTSIKSAEWVYSMMLYMTSSLGVNCTYCHNTRAMSRWDQSTPQRATAWHGIQMTRTLNNEFLTPLTPLFPAYRLGPSGDGPKIGCATCHKGTYKPLFGVSPLPDYPALSGFGKVPPGVPSEPAPAPSAAGEAKAETASR